MKIALLATQNNRKKQMDIQGYYVVQNIYRTPSKLRMLAIFMIYVPFILSSKLDLSSSCLWSKSVN